MMAKFILCSFSFHFRHSARQPFPKLNNAREPVLMGLTGNVSVQRALKAENETWPSNSTVFVLFIFTLLHWMRIILWKQCRGKSSWMFLTGMKPKRLDLVCVCVCWYVFRAGCVRGWPDLFPLPALTAAGKQMFTTVINTFYSCILSKVEICCDIGSAKTCCGFSRHNININIFQWLITSNINGWWFNVARATLHDT